MTFSVDNNDRFWEEPSQKGWFQFPGPLRYVLLLVLIVGLVIGLWYFIPSSSSSLNKGDLPLVKADEAPFKIKAEDQGVPNVNHQDKLVYDRIRHDDNRPTVEHILPLPEAPLAQITEPPIQMDQPYNPEDLEIEAKPIPAGTDALPPSSSLTSIEDLLDEITPVATGAKKESPQTAAKAETSNKSKTLIQLGSLKSYDLAKEEWTRLTKKHKTILARLEPLIQKVDLGVDQGIYYRLRAGWFPTHDLAKAACSSLKEEKTDCRVVP